jgi:hypothetical protein
MFKGHDYAEILSALGIELDDCSGGVKEAQEKMCQLFPDPSTFGEAEEEKQAISLMREFLTALMVEEAQYGYAASLWAGLGMIQENTTFVRYFIKLLPNMWT